MTIMGDDAHGFSRMQTRSASGGARNWIELYNLAVERF